MNPAVRRRVLAEWRGHDEPAVERPVASTGQVVDEALRGLGLSDLLDENRVVAAWREIAGDFLADHSVPARLKGGTLTVQVLQPALRFELERAGRSDLLPRLQARFGKRTVRKLEFRIG